MWKGRKPIEGAPYWYNTPLENLDFEWTREEKVEIERYCEKIRKNNGGYGGRGEVDLEAAANWHHEHGCFISFTIEDHPMEHGPISAIEEQMKEHVLRHKHMPKFLPGAKATYWTPMAHIEAAFATVKKYGRYD